MTEPRRIGDTPQGAPVHAFYAPNGAPRRPVIARGEGIYIDVAALRITSNTNSG